jgi:hypothetical protein
MDPAMSQTTFSVAINGVTYLSSHQGREMFNFQRDLSRAHKQEKSFCLCNTKYPVKLIVKLYGSDTDHMHYGLAKWPDTGLDHDPACDYFGEENGKIASGDNKPAFEDVGNGINRAYLATVLKIIERNVQAIAIKKTIAPQGDKRQRASEITLLLKLWRTAGLNVYRGQSRNWFNATFNLINASKKFIINRDGELLSQYLLIGAGRTDKLALEHNAKVLEAAKTAYTRLFVIGRLKTYGRDKKQFMLPLRDFNGLPKVSVKLDQLDTLMNDRQFYQNVIKEDSGNIIVIACIEPTKNEWWSTISITGIATSPNLLPAESSFEIEFDNYLAGQARKYIKPIVMDETGDDVQRPDYILLDTNPRAYCEVWGMNTEEYLSGKKERIERYKNRNQILVSWNANPREEFPRLPNPC